MFRQLKYYLLRSNSASTTSSVATYSVRGVRINANNFRVYQRSAPLRSHYGYSTSVTNSDKAFNKILIANRGEIACRVIRTARKMGIKTVAIFSDADATSLHAQMADEAFNVGPPPTSQSYLNMKNIIEAIKSTGAQAVHPGYGFLSENHAFVTALDEAKVTFIGPSQSAMASMGDKIQSKIIAKESGVNTIPGFNGVVKDTDHALQIAREIGYPVMLKASAGGGGKGMRIAWDDEEVINGFKIASNESLSSFGDSRLLIEKFIEDPRHIEIQILADKHGNTIYLPERECSIQRRNQKVVEEAPSTHLDEKTRKAMGEQAVALAKHVEYSSAGTVEFLVDKHRNFYFLEMNTRLQVEHPITEYITGIDLVEQMILIASGKPLLIKQEDVLRKGWAIESRVYAEDPENYLPSIGKLSKYIEPPNRNQTIGITEQEITGLQSIRDQVRCDSGIVEGSEISIYYDPMICKLCTYGATRDEAIAIMKRALDSYVIKGVTHNIPLLREVISHKRFNQGDTSTKFLQQEYPNGFKGHQLNAHTSSQLLAIAAMVHVKREQRNYSWITPQQQQQSSSLLFNSSNRTQHLMPPLASQWNYWIQLSNVPDHSFTTVQVIAQEEPNKFKVVVDKQNEQLVSIDWPTEQVLIKAEFQGGEQVIAQYIETSPHQYTIQFYGTKFQIVVHNEIQHKLQPFMKQKSIEDMNKYILSPMPGSIVSINVKEGDMIAEGAELVVVEAMKMQNVLRAARAGKVKKIHVENGSSVAADEIILEFED